MLVLFDILFIASPISFFLPMFFIIFFFKLEYDNISISFIISGLNKISKHNLQIIKIRRRNEIDEISN